MGAEAAKTENHHPLGMVTVRVRGKNGSKDLFLSGEWNGRGPENLTAVNESGHIQARGSNLLDMAKSCRERGASSVIFWLKVPEGTPLSPRQEFERLCENVQRSWPYAIMNVTTVQSFSTFLEEGRRKEEKRKKTSPQPEPAA